MVNNTEEQMVGILMPELVIYRTLNSILDIVRNDSANRAEEDTILYHYFGLDQCKNPMEWESFNYYKQAKELFTQQNKIQVNLGYNLEVSDIPCIHIMLPNESGKPLGLGADENYVGYAKQSNDDRHRQAIFTENFDATYNLVITSPNTLEVILIYNFLKASLISLHAHLGLSGLLLPKISGQDIQLQSDLVPANIFHRALGLAFTYEVHVPDIMRSRLIKDFKVTGIICVNKE